MRVPGCVRLATVVDCLGRATAPSHYHGVPLGRPRRVVVGPAPPAALSWPPSFVHQCTAVAHCHVGLVRVRGAVIRRTVVLFHLVATPRCAPDHSRLEWRHAGRPNRAKANPQSLALSM